MPQQAVPQSAGPILGQPSQGPFPGQQGYGGPQAQPAAQYPNQQMAYGGSASAGGYGRGAPTSNPQWTAPAGQNFPNGGFSAYQG